MRKLTPQEIAQSLPRYGILDPETNKPYPLDIIEADVAAIETGWQEYAEQDEALSRILAELQEVKKTAWAGKDLKAILAAIKQEREMLNTKNPPPSSTEAVEDDPPHYVELSKRDFDNLFR